MSAPLKIITLFVAVQIYAIAVSVSVLSLLGLVSLLGFIPNSQLPTLRLSTRARVRGTDK